MRSLLPVVPVCLALLGCSTVPEPPLSPPPIPAPAVKAPILTPAPAPMPVQAPLLFDTTPPNITGGLTDRNWRLIVMNGNYTPDGLGLRFQGRTVSGASGCSRFENVRVILEGPDLRFGAIRPEPRNCDAFHNDLEARYLEALGKVRRHEIDGEIMVLTGVGTRLTYESP